MKSLQAFTYEMDDLDEAVNELKSQIDLSKLLKNTCAIINCSYEIDVAKLREKLVQAFDFPFIGCTGIGILSSEGFSQGSISMLVMTADDCTFEIGMTDEINDNNDLKVIGEKYNELTGEFNGRPNMIFAYAPWWENIVSDYVVRILDEVSEGVPVFGGIASDDWSFNKNYVFSNENFSDTAVVMMLVYGNIKPVFTIEHSTTGLTNSHKIVTRSEDTKVYSLNDETATEYLAGVGITNPKENVMLDYLATPFISTITTEDNDEIDVLRALVSINHEENSCSFIGSVEEGSELNMVLISKKDIEGSVKKAFDDIFEMINKEKDYKYSVILCSSCGARYTLIVADKNTEGKAYVDRLPDGINIQGFYSFGEYCPAKGKKYGKLYNILSNETLAIVAF